MVDNVCADLLLVGPGANGNCYGGPGGLVSCLCCSPFYTEMEYCIHIGQPASTFGKIDSSYILGGGVYVMAQGGAYVGCASVASIGNRHSSGEASNYAAGGGAGAGENAPNATRCYGSRGGCGLCGYGGGGGGWGRYGGGGASDGGGAGGTGGGAAGNATNYGGGGGGSCVSANNGCGCQGVVDICYPTDGSYGIHCATGGTKSLVDGMCVHRFTSDGTFCIIS